ncbi:MAG: 1-deoxy-D-xylulose-5-phosphate synthase [Candidatus Omnitrophica bacterium]|nr:1-deoxy-D-xylulose-5-phosphate synthase [Candidatus Omnitrophota bacterium]
MLEKINFPKELKKLNIKELKILSEEIRNLIIEVVSKKGGHLASSLGCVELCIALHYCLDTPTDTIIFDVGHQTYAHKILTGRKDKFYKLREYGGISGFPNPNESIFDVYISGHASTAISWAQGIAEAKRLKGDNSKTIAVIGDGSLTGGMCFEALNSCGHMQSEVLVILNHNDLSIAPSVGALSNYLNKIISAPIYNRIKSELEKFLKHFSVIKKIAPKVKKFEETIKGLIVPGIFFEELGFRYFGPIDGHNLELLISTLKNISSLKGPRLLHIITKKGKGYKFAEDNPQDFHSAVFFNIQTGTPLKEHKETFSEVFAKKLIDLAKDDNRIVALTAAMPKGTGLDLFEKNFPQRFFDVGIAEEHTVGLASGLAKEGFKPIVAIYSTFLQRSFDQIIHDVALQNLGVVFAIDRAGLVGEDGPTHHGVFDIGYMRLVPNLVCLAPKDKEELEDMLEFAVKLNLPVSIRYPKDHAYSLNKREKIELGKSQILNEGDDVCIIAVGSMVKVGYEVLNLVKDFGISLFLVNARFIKPLDEELLIYIAKRFNIIFTIEEANLNCGFGSAILEFYEKEGLLGKIKLIRLGLPDEFIPVGKREELLKMYGLDAKRISERIKKTIYKENLLWQRL